MTAKIKTLWLQFRTELTGTAITPGGRSRSSGHANAGRRSLNPDIFDALTMLAAALLPTIRCYRLPARLRPGDIAAWRAPTPCRRDPARARVIYESHIPAGPFRIQDINETVSGDLHAAKLKNKAVRCEYDVSTAYSVSDPSRALLAAGRPQDWDHNMEGGFSPQPKPPRGSLTAGRCTAAP